jgi:hypothetical protein
MMSAMPRPVTTADEVIGMDLNLSMKPFSLLMAIAKAVFMKPNAIVIANRPGMA